MTTASPWRWWRVLASICIFEAAWFACISAVAHGAIIWGLCAVTGSILWQLALSDRPATDMLLMLTAGATGLAWDTFLVQAHLVVYASPVPSTALAPVWIVALWAQLGAVLREPLRWLHHRLLLAAALGGVGGALSFAAAMRIGAVEFPDIALSMLVLAAGWAVLLPLLLRLARRLMNEP